MADPFATLDVPGMDCVFVKGAKISKGSRVRLHPKRRADVWDLFLDGKSRRCARFIKTSRILCMSP